MTAPTATAAPARIHRRRTPATPDQAHVEQAATLRRMLANRKSVTVEITGRGHGWWVLAVRDDGFYRVRRSGDPLLVEWADVPPGQV